MVDTVIRRLHLGIDDSDIVWLYMGRAQRQAAQIIGTLVPRGEHDIAALERAIGRTFSHVCVITNAVVIEDRLLGRGHGVRLYAALAEHCARDFDAPIVSAGTPSFDARRVWSSRRLTQRLVVENFTAWPRTWPAHIEEPR